MTRSGMEVWSFWKWNYLDNHGILPNRWKMMDGEGTSMGIFSKLKTAGRVVLIDVDRLLPNPSQPRRFFDPDELRTLADSIAENGILQPLSVREITPWWRRRQRPAHRRRSACAAAPANHVFCLFMHTF